MDIEKAGCYKLYRCRSLLACDSGGTVYDTSQRLEDSDYDTFYKNAEESQSESGQSENIIYIIGKDNRVKTSNSPVSQPSLADPNSHLDDDELNNYEPWSNANNDSECDIVQYVKEENVNQDDNCKYYFVQCDDIDSTQNSATETLDSDSFDRENFENYCDSINVGSSVDVSINSNNSDTASGNIIQEDAQLNNLSNFSEETTKSFDSQDATESENYSPLNLENDTTTKHSRKRKQTYKVKNDSFTELLEDDSSDTSSVSDNSKKKKSAYIEDNQRRKLQFKKCNPFENLKMSSILKKDHFDKNQIRSKDCRKESLASSNDENSEPSNVSSNDEEVFNHSERSYQSRYSSSFPYNDNFFKITDTSVRLNSDLTNADYLEYVQPRERIVESDMDKLLSPTIEVEISTVLKHCKINRFVQQTQGQVDYNGNEVNSKENFNNDSNSKISASEVVEKQLVLKAAYAIKHGYQNIFNTSNECVVEEILFDHSFTYRNIQLETDFIYIRQNFHSNIPLVLLDNTGEYLVQHQQSNDPFRNVSCSLQDTLNDFDSFGEFAEDNSNREDKISQTEEVHYVVQNSQDTRVFAGSNTFQKTVEYSQFKSSSSFNALIGESSIISYSNTNYNFSKYESNTSITEKQLITPLKMRIRRVSDDNQYVIDDSSIYNYQVNDEKTLKFPKNPDSKYECSRCSEKFRTQKLLKSHISENHKGPYDVECEICHMKSKKSSAHKKHQPWCERNTTLECKFCHKTYCYKAVLLRHLKTHKERLLKKDE